MAKLGSFQVAKRAIAAAETPPEPDTFDFEGEEFRVTTDIAPLVPLMELADAYQSTGDDEMSMPALAATWQMLRYCIHEEDWPRFRGLAMARKAGIDDLMPITTAVWESVTSRPTQGPSVSPDGPSNTSTNSKAGSPSPTDRPSSFRVDLSDERPSAPALQLLTPANEWSGPASRPDLGQPLVSVDDWVHGRTA